MNRTPQTPVAPLAKLIRSIVKERPGIHFRGLGRAANVSSTGQLRHHIDRLYRRGDLIEVEDGRFRRYFVPSDQGARVREGLARFARRVPKKIARILIKGKLNRTELREELGCADSTLGYHLRRMVRKGDLTRTPTASCCFYALSDPGFIREIIQRQDAVKESLEDEDGFADPPHNPAVQTSTVSAPTHRMIVEASASAESAASSWA